MDCAKGIIMSDNQDAVLFKVLKKTILNRSMITLMYLIR